MPETTENTAQEPQNDPQEALEGQEPTDGQETPPEPQDGQQEEQETFPRAYVEKLRQESGRYRQRAQEADALAHRLHLQLVKETGRLADPEDLPYAEEHLDDPDALNTAIEELISRKPHLASRRPRGDIGQGHSTDSTGNVDLAALLRSRA